jgi:predicted membrane protein
MADINSAENPEQYAERLRQEIHSRFRERMDGRCRRRSGRFGLFAGVFFIVFGILFLLQNLGVPYFDRVWDFWPVILIVLGLGRIARGWGFGGRLLGGALIGGGALIAAGTVFLLHNFHLIHGNVWNFLWPVILICVGLGMLVGTIQRRRYWETRQAAPTAGGPISAASGRSSVNVLDETAIFGGVRRRIESQEFEGGQATAICGGIELDLSKAATKKDEIVIEATAIFGGIDLRVPENWSVSARGTAILGGFEDKTMDARSGDVPPQTRLIIGGNAIFGGVTVKN